jgi:F-type H+-transporting ATPase subunit epsilon
MKELFLEVITPAKAAYSGSVISVTVPGEMGNFQVLFNHAPIMSSLEVGKIKIKNAEGKELEFFTGGGTIEVLNNKVTVLAESFESKEEIDLERAEKSLQRAKERLSGKNRNDIDIVRAQASLNRALNRIKFKNSGYSS